MKASVAKARGPIMLGRLHAEQGMKMLDDYVDPTGLIPA